MGDADGAGRLDLAVIVVSWNVRELLAGCLASLYAEIEGEAGLRAGVWVVDNASGDGSPDMLRESFPQVRLIANPDNRGFAAANNQALREMGLGDTASLALDCQIQRSAAGPGLGSPGRANGDAPAGLPNPAARLPRYVLFLNPDATLESGALHAWLATAEAWPAAGIVGAALRYPDGQFQHSAFAFPTLFQIVLDFYPLHYRLIHSRLNGRYPRAWYAAGRPFWVGHPLGAAMLARREAILAAGLLDEGFFIYAEEVDWCMRMRAAGWPALCAPAVRVVHHEAQSTRQFKERMFVALWKSRLRLFAKHYPPAFNAAARILLRQGLRSLRAAACRQHAAGQSDAETLQRRLAAFAEVGLLTRRPR